MSIEGPFVPALWPEVIGVGLLGAVSDVRHGLEGAREARLAMIERRILRLEMVLRRAGIEPESVELSR